MVENDASILRAIEVAMALTGQGKPTSLLLPIGKRIFGLGLPGSTTEKNLMIAAPHRTKIGFQFLKNLAAIFAFVHRGVRAGCCSIDPRCPKRPVVVAAYRLMQGQAIQRSDGDVYNLIGDTMSTLSILSAHIVISTTNGANGIP
jgi:hypothetical protein